MRKKIEGGGRVSFSALIGTSSSGSLVELNEIDRSFIFVRRAGILDVTQLGIDQNEASGTKQGLILRSSTPT